MGKLYTSVYPDILREYYKMWESYINVFGRISSLSPLLGVYFQTRAGEKINFAEARRARDGGREDEEEDGEEERRMRWWRGMGLCEQR